MTWQALWPSQTVKLPPEDGKKLVARIVDPANKTAAKDALAFLALRFTPWNPSALPEQCDAAQVVALKIAEAFDPTAAKTFLDQVVFNAAHPEAHLYLWFAVTKTTKPVTCEQEIIARLTAKNPLHRANAFAACAQVFDALDEYRLSATGHATISRAAQTIAADKTQPEPLRAIAAAFSLPAPQSAPAAAPPPPPIDVAKVYEAIGGGARDRTGKAAKAPGAKPTSTRNAAPLLASADFAKKMETLGVAAAVAEFLPKLGKIPEQMRILTLEALYGAEAAEDVKDIIAQTTAMLPS